ncbi:MAG: type II secretion system secretin GspD, partial [Gammaproteobacteria bacterium]|nr:type II secretion system secretin GspD [Gammaproteobacteria bacterium]
MKQRLLPQNRLGKCLPLVLAMAATPLGLAQPQAADVAPSAQNVAIDKQPVTAVPQQTPNQNQASGSSASQPAASNERFTMNMREADIRGFVQWIADRTQKNIIVHRSVRGAVTVISSRAVSPDEAYELFLTVLQLNGFTAIESDGAIKVVPDADAKTSDIPFAGNETRKGEVVTSIISLEHSEASDFVATLKPLVPSAAHLAAYAPTNSLIVATSARSIDKIMQIIRILDREEGEIDLEIIPIVHASAEDIVGVIESVVDALDGGGKAGAAGKAKQDKIDFAVDKRSNSILITGNKKKRTQIKKLIARLDTPLDGAGNTQVVYLNYIEAAEISPILQSVGDSMLKESKTEGIKSFSIESSEANNALVISAPPSLMNNLKSVIAQLDIQRAQVLIEAVLVQVSGDAGDDFGVVWGASEIYDSNPDGAVAAVNTPTAAANPAGLLGAALADDDGLTSEELAAGLISNSGLSFGYLKDGNLIGALQAISTRNKSNILSTPTIVALDNEEATLLVGQNVPFITGSSTSSGSTVTNPFQTVERQDVGISLTVTPRINQGDSVTLEIEQT